MIELTTLFLSLVALFVLAPALLLFVQIVASVLPRAKACSPASAAPADRPTVAVVVPAHNECAGIARTVESIRAQLPERGRVLVVADNCTDDTAQLAAAAGAAVSERRDPTRIGKGYALDHGVRVLAETGAPDIVIFIDADCEVASGTLATIAERSFATGRPVQAHDVVRFPPSSGTLDRITQFAWQVKSLLRPLGSSRLGWPCQLMGTGMAIPWPLLGQIDLAAGHLAEDQKLGADLALLGRGPLFCPEARVTSWGPSDENAKRQQRMRWEHGHLAIIRQHFPRLLAHSISRRDLALLAFVIDLCIPPLSLFTMLIVLLQCVALSWFLTAARIGPLLIASGSLMLLAGAIGLAWWRVGRDVISLRDILATPAYCVWKIPSFLRFFTGRQVGWIRTERS